MSSPSYKDSSRTLIFWCLCSKTASLHIYQDCISICRLTKLWVSFTIASLLYSRNKVLNHRLQDLYGLAISKLWTLNYEKLEICVTLISISHYIEAKFVYGYFIIFLHYGSKILHKKFKVILSKNKGVTLIFPIKNEIKFWGNRLHFWPK